MLHGDLAALHRDFNRAERSGLAVEAVLQHAQIRLHAEPRESGRERADAEETPRNDVRRGGGPGVVPVLIRLHGIVPRLHGHGRAGAKHVAPAAEVVRGHELHGVSAESELETRVEQILRAVHAARHALSLQELRDGRLFLLTDDAGADCGHLRMQRSPFCIACSVRLPK